MFRMDEALSIGSLFPLLLCVGSSLLWNGYTMLWQNKKVKIRLKYTEEQEAEKYLLNKASLLLNMSEIDGSSVGNFNELMSLIQDRIKLQCAVPEPFCSAMLLHLDVVALNISMRITSGEQLETFLKRIG